MTRGLISDRRVDAEHTWWWTLVLFLDWGKMRVPVALYSHQTWNSQAFKKGLVNTVSVLSYLTTFNLHFSEKSWGWVPSWLSVFGYPLLRRARSLSFFKNIEFFVFSLLTYGSSFFILNEAFVGYNYCKYLFPINGLPFHFNGIYFLRNRIS